jgi:WD40 repeat protein
VSTGSDRRIKIWDARTLTIIKGLQPIEDTTWASAFSLDDRRLATGRFHLGSSLVSIMDIHTGRELMAIPTNSGVVRQIAWSPDGAILLARLNDGQAWMIAP